ncbi:MAG: glycine/sarcosine/betaine reductase selenoprotein B family protein [Desulfurivibrionaceae bacterium]|jgi:D-proline reductase (dithiol) PrdB|nr:glycine/sarcosine/betaine reductase selenoprotein B family protein [Desulfurivibrionaceae bacterium]
MARLADLPEPLRTHIANLPCPTFNTNPWHEGPPLATRRIAIISTAGLHVRGDRPFTVMSGDYRIIPGDVSANDLVMSHVSINFDRTGFQQDWNVIFPLDRLNELANQGSIGSVADFHYSFMGATDPLNMKTAVRNLADILKKDGVNAVLLVPV